MGRKKKGELPSGSIRTRVYLGKDASGKRKYKSITAATRADLDAAVALYKAGGGAEKEKTDSKPSLTVEGAVQHYIELKRPVLSPASVRGYTGIVKTYIKPEPIGQYDVQAISQQDVQLWISTLASSVSPKTVRNAYALLLSSVRMFRPDFQPQITLPQKKPAELYCPSDTDVKALLSVVKDSELEIAILLAAFGPMRRSEICALESSDITGDRISITKAMVQDEHKKWVIKEPKTVASRRCIQMPAFVIDKLRGINGRIIKSTPSALSDRFQRAILEANCPRFRFHDLRHYGASILLAIGVPDKYAMARGGWASTSCLKRVYQGIIDEEEVKQTEKILNHFSTLAGA